MSVKSKLDALMEIAEIIDARAKSCQSTWFGRMKMYKEDSNTYEEILAVIKGGEPSLMLRVSKC